MTSIFSKILSGEIPATFVYRDELVAAFMDIHPINPGHTLVIPIKPAKYLHEVEEATSARLISVAKKISVAIRNSELRCEDITFSIADGEAAGQEVPHVHLHIIPRFKGDGFGWKVPPGYGNMAQRAELEAAASSIKNLLEKAGVN